MGLFGRKKKAEAPQNSGNENARVKVLGSGCANCQKLENNVKEALGQLGMAQEVGHVADFVQIAAYGVMSTPALVIDEKVVSYGKVLEVQEAARLLAEHYQP